MQELKIVYIDDRPDIVLSKYIDTELVIPEVQKEYEEIRFVPQDGYESLIKNPKVQSANIIIIDSMLFENKEPNAGKFTGEEFKIILKKYYPFIEVIVITQNVPEGDMGTISKYHGNEEGKSATEYYNNILPERIIAATDNIKKYRVISDKLKGNSSLDKYLVEKVVSSLNGTSVYDELTKSDIDELVEAFKKIEK